MSAEARSDIEIRSVLIPLAESNLLLPNAAVAELIDYRPLDALEGTPDWLLGATNWRQRSLWVVDFERLLGMDVGPGGARQRIVVCHVLNENAGRPFVGLLAQAIPRLVRVREDVIEMDESGDATMGDLPVHARIRLGDQVAMIPDLGAIGIRLTSAI